MSTSDYPAVVEVKLGNGYRYKTSATDEEAAKIIKQLSDMTLAAWQAVLGIAAEEDTDARHPLDDPDIPF